MKRIQKKHCLTWLLITILALTLVGCGSDDFSVTMITTNSGQNLPAENGVFLDVRIPGTDNAEEHRYTVTVPAEGKNALTLLEDMGKAEGFPVISGSGYVESIDGVAQYMEGPESGWLYLVNGKMASVGADQYIPQANDVINWIYITSYDQLNNYESLE